MSRTISEAQERRLWAIALETGYQRQGVYRLVQQYGYDEPADVLRSDYDEICAAAEDEERAWKLNRDPDTLDMFSGGPRR